MKKKKDEKILLLFEKLKILCFYWNENLNPFQLSKKKWKKFFGFEVMGNSLEVVFAKKNPRFCRFFPTFAQKI